MARADGPVGIDRPRHQDLTGRHYHVWLRRGVLVLIAAVLPAASTQARREKEDELIFRGRQYAEGIRCFRRRYGRFPTSLKEMLEAHE